MNKTDLKAIESLSDDELLVRLANVLGDARRVESVLLAHIAEVDARRLYAREASPSMHKYCTDVLHLSDAEAYFRITAARASRRHPVLLTRLEEGRLHLSGIQVIAPHLDRLNGAERDALLAKASHKSKDELKELVATMAPKPDIAPSIRKLPKRNNKSAPAPEDDRGESRLKERTLSRQSPLAPSTEPAPRVRERQQVEPLAPTRYKVQFTASTELREKLQRLAALMPGEDLAAVIEAAVTEKLERIEARRFGKVNKPRKSFDDADTAPGARGIAAPVRRFVWARDGGRCTFRAHDGRRCPERHNVEFHHDYPFARGGDRSASNIRLLCRTHNALMAEKDYGKQLMDAYRRSTDRAREPSPAFELHPRSLERGPMTTSVMDGATTVAQPAYASTYDERLNDLVVFGRGGRI